MWRAKCPVHKSRGMTLAIKAGRDRIHLTCHAGCHSDDVLATLGLKWQDMLYHQPDSKAWREEQKLRRKQTAEAYRARIKGWVRLFRVKGYNSRARDQDVAIALAQIMAVEGPKPHLERLLAIHMERLTAAQFLDHA